MCGLNAFEDITCKIVLRQRHQVAHGLLAINFKYTTCQLGLFLREYIGATRAQTLFRIVTFTKSFAKAVNDRTFQSGREIRGRFGRFGIIPDSEFLGAGRSKQSIKIVLPRATLKINQLGDTETS